MEYFKPRFIKVSRIGGQPNMPGSIIQYRLPFRFLGFCLVLDRIIDDRYLVYKVKDGFAKGGILVFDIEKIGEKAYMLFIYVAFNFPKGKTGFSKLYWNIYKKIFPGYLHDVLWNHSLCKLKDIIELSN